MHQLVECFGQAGLLFDGRLVPAPGARSRSDGSMPAWTSFCALITVLRDRPDALATAVLPPRPSDSAIAPATTRRCTSFKCGITTEKNRSSSSPVACMP